VHAPPGAQQEAEELLRRAVTIRPDMLGGLFNLAAITYERGAYREAESYMSRYTRVAPPTLDSLVLGVKIARATGDRNTEESNLQQLRRLFPKRRRPASSSRARSRFVEAIADPAPRERPGRILAAERERQGLGPAEIAQRLHMSVSQVEALEGRRLLEASARHVPARLRAQLREDPRHSLRAAARRARGRRAARAGPGHRRSDPEHPFRRRAHPQDLPSRHRGRGVLLVFGFAAMYWLLFIRPAPPATARTVARRRPGPNRRRS
jgi:hypothetical protein